MIFSSRHFFQKTNEQIRLYYILVNLFSFVVWKKVKTPKRHFEIIWPLRNFSFNIKQATNDNEWYESAAGVLLLTHPSQISQSMHGYILIHSLKQSVFHEFWICRRIIQIEIRLLKYFNSIVVIARKYRIKLFHTRNNV